MFFGAENCKYEFHEEKFIPANIVNKLIEEVETKEEKIREQQVIRAAENVEATDDLREYLTEKLHNTFLGDYNRWFPIACVMRKEGFTYQQFEYAPSVG